MDKATLREVITEQNHFKQYDASTLEREQLATIKSYLDLPHAVIISGIRRAGKSTLLAEILAAYYPKGVYYLSFEDERLLNFDVQDFNQLYEVFVELYDKRDTFFFDEIQNVEKWEMFVRRMQDNGFKFFITGSNASLLSKELGTKLTGRCVIVELYPFSFKEFLAFKKHPVSNNMRLDTTARGLLKKQFMQYLKNGGMPEYLKYHDTYVLKRTYEDILYRDIVARHEIKETKALRELCLFLLSNIGRQISFNKIKGMLQLGSVNTIKSYVLYLEDSYLFFTVNRFSFSLKQQTIAYKKIYAIDNGIISAVAFQFSKNEGQYLENLVFLELKRRGHEIFYYKTSSDLEVDFLIREGNKIKSLIQVSCDITQPKTRERELAALVAAMDELKLTTSLILTLDYEETIVINKKEIVIKPVYKWLLE